MGEPSDTESQSATPVDADQGEKHLSRPFMGQIADALAEGNRPRIDGLIAGLPAADLADVVEMLAADEREGLLASLGARLEPALLAELEGGAREQVLAALPNAQIAEAVCALETDDAVEVLENLDASDREAVLDALDEGDRTPLERSLAYPEDSAGRLMQTEVVALPAFWTVGQTIDHLRSDSVEAPDDFYDIIVVDPLHRPLGKIPVSRLMRTRRPHTLEEIMNPDPYQIDVIADQEDVAYQFAKYHLISAAVVDSSGRLLGVITVDDVVDVIGEEAGEDILALAGVVESGSGESLGESTRGRMIWLAVNLATAILASLVIGLFDQAIETLVALAVLMPIVASMGGNAGTQTMTVTVRALATRDLSSVNAARTLRREVAMAGLNGLALSAVSAVVALLWFGNFTLALIFAAAMLFNMITAALSGVLLPMLLARLNIDPAVASSVFVTTITDVVGFFVFLGLAASIYL